MGFEEHVDAFCAYLRLERNASDATVEAYGRDLTALAKHLQSAGAGHELPDREDIVGFIVERMDAGLSAQSIQRALSACSSFFRFLRDEGLAVADPVAEVNRPRARRPLPSVLSVDEATRLVEAPSGDAPAAVRDRALLELLYGCGLRVSEAVGLTAARVHWDRGLLHLRGKGRKERLVPFGGPAGAALRRWLEHGRPPLLRRRVERGGARHDHVFTNLRGGPLSRQAAHAIVKQHAVTAGITRKVSPHTLRHSYATHLLAGGADLRTVQLLLGHADLGTTQIYTHVERTQMEETFRRYHPRFNR